MEMIGYRFSYENRNWYSLNKLGWWVKMSKYEIYIKYRIEYTKYFLKKMHKNNLYVLPKRGSR